jgi:hypothetical protein
VVVRADLDHTAFVGVLHPHETKIINDEGGQEGAQLRLVTVVVGQVLVAGSIAQVDEGEALDLLTPAQRDVGPVASDPAIGPGNGSQPPGLKTRRISASIRRIPTAVVW